MMKLGDILSCYGECKLYSFLDEIEKFDSYFGMSIDEIEDMFRKENVVSWRFVYDKLVNLNFDKNIIMNKLNTYKYYRNILLNLSCKGVELVNLLKYLCSVNGIDNINDNYEVKLEEIGIYHFNSILKGEDINRILIVIYHLINNYLDTLKIINGEEFYTNRDMIASFTFVDERVDCPNRELIVYDNEYVNLSDKTSFVVSSPITKKRVKLKIGN